MSILNRSLLSVITIAASVLGVVGALSAAHAENIVEIIPASVGSGIQGSMGQCPCFRWVVQVRGVSGRIETQDILISTDALFKFQQTNDSKFQNLASRVFTVGAIEALIKGGNVGMGFKGVSFGEDANRGFSSLLRTGLYAIINMVQQDGLRFGIHSGYDFEKIKAAMSGIQAERHLITNAAVLNWDSGPWSGAVDAHIAFSPTNLDGKHVRVGTGANFRGRVLSFSDLELGLSADFNLEHDPFLEFLGLKPLNATGMIMMDLSWVAERSH